MREETIISGWETFTIQITIDLSQGKNKDWETDLQYLQNCMKVLDHYFQDSHKWFYGAFVYWKP